MDWLRVDHCRALGNTLAAFFTGGDGISIVNSTFHGQGDGLIMGGPREGFECTGTETMTARNNIFAGSADYFDPSDITFLFYQEGCPGLKLDADYNIVHNAKNIECGAAGDHAISGTHDLCEDPLLTGPLFGMEFGMMPGPTVQPLMRERTASAPPLKSSARPGRQMEMVTATVCVISALMKHPE